jgi:hypothetical protein
MASFTMKHVLCAHRASKGREAACGGHACCTAISLQTRCHVQGREQCHPAGVNGDHASYHNPGPGDGDPPPVGIVAAGESFLPIPSV